MLVGCCNLMFALPKKIHRAVYTTNVIESSNYSLRKIRKPAPKKPLSNCSNWACKTPLKKWTMPIQNWSLAMNQMAILFEGRMLIPGMTENSITQNI
jgi:putative transposase